MRPAAMRCAVCGQEFAPTRRKQGGGRRQIYCSRRCNNRRYLLQNPEARRATIVRYEAVPENKAKKRRRQRLQTLARYGWTEARFKQALRRQRYRCATCPRRLTTQTARIDHCHRTNRVRGLLCDPCNWGLGHVCDSIVTLKRMIRYLQGGA